MKRYKLYFSTLLVAALLFVGCQKSLLLDSVDDEIVVNDGIAFEFSMLDSDVMGTRSDGTLAENSIDNGKVYFFAVNSLGVLTDKPVKASFSISGGKAYYFAGLTTTNEPRTVYALVNVQSDPNSDTSVGWTVGTTTITQIRNNYLTQSWESSTGSGWITSQLSTNHPMSGSVDLSAGIVKGSIISISIKRVTSKAVVSVATSLQSSFKMAGISVVNATVRSLFLEGGTPTTTIAKAHYSASAGNLDAMFKGASSDGVQSDVVYLWQSNVTANSTALLIKATFNGVVGYYKIDFIGSNGVDIAQIQRNVFYKVEITSVSSAGYSSASLALANVAANRSGSMTVGVEVVDGDARDVVSLGDKYIGFSNSEYIVFANDARGVTATTLMHNASSATTPATVKVTGSGVKLIPISGVMTVSADSTVGTFVTLNGAQQKIPIKLNIYSTASDAKLSFVIGTLTKDVAIKRRAAVADNVSVIIPPTAIGAEDFVSVQSLSTRVAVNGDYSLNVNQVIGRSLVLYSNVRAFSKNSRGTVLISVKNSSVREVVYYEKYSDGGYGFYFEPTLSSTLSNTKTIIEAGYGCLTSGNLATQNIAFGSRAAVAVAGVVVDGVFEDCAAVLYGVKQSVIATESQVANALSVSLGGVSSGMFIYPNFACGVYSSSVISNSATSPFIVRTPRQLINITPVAQSRNYYYRQDRDLDFSAVTEIGGAASFVTPAVNGRFNGIYDGANRVVTNFVLNGGNGSNFGLFHSFEGSIRNLKLTNSSITGEQQVGGVLGEGVGVSSLYNVSISNVKVTGQFYVGGIVGIMADDNSFIENCSTDAACSVASLLNAVSGVGGIVGDIRKTSYVKGCTNAASVTSVGSVGGIVGKAVNGYSAAVKGLIVNCSNSGNVVGTGSDNNIGGIVGVIESFVDVASCTNSGTVTSPYRCIGGIVGHVLSNSNITGCINTGNIICTNTLSTPLGYTGGIVGHIYSPASKVLVDGCVNRGQIDGKVDAGGIVGYVGANDGTCVISKCVNYGVVNGSWNVGGIAGTNYAIIRNCAVVDSRATQSTSLVVGSTGAVGGVVGYNISLVEDCLVIDTRRNPVVQIAYNGTGYNYSVGGIAGHVDNGTVNRSILLAVAPNKGGLIRPVFGGYVNSYSFSSNYYLRGSLDNSLWLNTAYTNGGSVTGQNTTAFGTLPSVSTAPWSTYWQRQTGYSYPKLISFDAFLPTPYAN